MRKPAKNVVYRGSVKNLIALAPPTPARPGRFLVEFTDDFSVFDYGKMPDRLEGKGEALALMTAWLFERLADPREWKALAGSSVWSNISDPEFRTRLLKSPLLKRFQKSGMPTHYRGIIPPGKPLTRTPRLETLCRRIEVWAVQILKPERGEIEGSPVWNYNRFHYGADNFLIPLEVVFRFGTPTGSSLLERVKANPRYLETLGVDRVEEGRWLPRPVGECFSKLEPSDRALSPELALNFSGLTNPEFAELLETSFLLAVFLKDRFARAGIELWDGKFEFLRVRKRILLGDAITPDELRLVKDGIQISKEPIRQYYRRRHPEFLKMIAEAKPKAHRTGRKIGAILKDRGYLPPRLDPEFKKVAEDMYLGLVSELTGLKLLPPHRPLAEVVQLLKKWVG